MQKLDPETALRHYETCDLVIYTDPKTKRKAIGMLGTYPIPEKGFPTEFGFAGKDLETGDSVIVGSASPFDFSEAPPHLQEKRRVPKLSLSYPYPKLFSHSQNLVPILHIFQRN